MTTHRIRARLPAGRPDDGAMVTTGPGATDAYLEDAAHFPGGHATAVAHPRSEADIASLLEKVRRLLPVGAQSSLTGGATPMGDTVLATDGLDRVLATDHSEARVQAGVTLETLSVVLDRTGTCYPPVPTFEGATAGGIVATNAAGPSTFKYGTTRDWVQGLTVVLADGTVLDLHRGDIVAHPGRYFEIVDSQGPHRVPIPDYVMPDVPKRSAGYYARDGMDLVDLFIGSEGTLGIVTEVTLRVLPRKPAHCLLWIPVPGDERRALELVHTLRESARATWRSRDPRGIDIASIEHLDRRSLEVLREDGVDRRNRITIPPETTVALLVRVEFPPDSAPCASDAYDQIQDALSPRAPDTPLVRVCRILERSGVLDETEIALGEDRRRQRELLALREAVPEGINRRVGGAKRLAPEIRKTAADMIVPFGRFEESLQVFRGTFEHFNLDVAIWGHISDGNLHPNVIPASLDDVTRGEAAILECGRAIIGMGGCPLAEHGVGRSPVKQALLRLLYGAHGVAQMQRVKASLDPSWKLAPGVLFPSAEVAGSR